MNIREMQYRFGIHLNQFGEGLALNSDDMDYWLNKAQIDLVKSIYNGITADRKGFEQSQKRTDDLRVLLKRAHEISTTYVNDLNASEGFKVDRAVFPNDYMFLISNKSLIHYNHPTINWTTSNNKRVSVTFTPRVVSNRVSQSDDIYTLLDDPFNTTKVTSPLIVISTDGINVFTDKTFIVDKIIIDYIKKPVRLNIKGNISCELPEHLHEDIIQRAADLFLNNTRQLKQRLQRETPASGQQQNIENDE